MKIIQIFLCSVFFSISVAAVRYDNFALYRIFPRSIHDLNIIRNLQTDASHNYDFWTDPISLERSVDILVHPEKKHMLNDFVKTNGLNFQIITDNIQERIDEEATMSVLRTLHDDNDDLTWDKYNDLDTIYRWLKKLAKDNPDKVTLVEGGRTYENRSILGVKISFGTQQRQRTAVWIDSQIHAREWISGATSTYILNAVLYSDDPNIRTMAENHDWYFFPVINPDGYVYTYTSDRLWRKTRTPYKSCYGADPNRNWDYKWNQGGSSDDPCDDTYAGPSAFSEIETKTLADYMANVADELLLFLTFHSYSQLILIPYGHTTEHLDNYNITYPIGLKAADKLSQRYGTQYTVGDIAETIYVATGSNMDWIKGNYHIPFAYCYELRDTGKYGFILPPEQIIPTALETLDSIATILEEADKSN